METFPTYLDGMVTFQRRWKGDDTICVKIGVDSTPLSDGEIDTLIKEGVLGEYSNSEEIELWLNEIRAGPPPKSEIEILMETIEAMQEEIDFLKLRVGNLEKGDPVKEKYEAPKVFKTTFSEELHKEVIGWIEYDTLSIQLLL